jgi:hypothetical protein
MRLVIEPPTGQLQSNKRAARLLRGGQVWGSQRGSVHSGDHILRIVVTKMISS